MSRQETLGDGAAQWNPGGFPFGGRIDCRHFLISDLNLRITGQAPLTEPLIGECVRLKTNTVG